MKTWLIEQKNGRPAMTEWQRADFHDYCKRNPKSKFNLTPLESTRTMSQNKLYWLYLGVIERETGENATDLHEYFKRTLLPPRFIKVRGKELKIPASTTTMKKLEFGEYMEKICVETGIPIPDTEAYNDEQDKAPMLNEQ